ncbi:DUF4431 domain-containing protein [Mesorhizobium sp. CAU 1741]|uniref:DUF4431 domain-containing protein n=1 Tax=Mesorhizobium sp. CAU 1741 TaxID=3140366 RepID=UPI00325A9E2B
MTGHERIGLRMRLAVGVISAVASLLAAGKAMAGAPGSCLKWDGPATLEGYVVEGIFPGPPGYEDIANGDMELHAEMLYLLEPICVDGPDAMDAEPVESTELVQLACSGMPLSQMRGRVVSFNGSLFSQHTGYHRTPVLLLCE